MSKPQRKAAEGRVIRLRHKLPIGGLSEGNSKARELPKQADSIGVARYWFARGIRCVPIRSRGKKPIGGEGWNKLRVEPKTIPEFFPRGCNVGGLWGEPSGGIVDIDLDTEESRLVAQKYLPETFVYGRASAPASHYLYRCKGINTKKYQTKEEGTFVEIRSTGTQSVLPPSIHPEGEAYEIYHDVEFTEIGLGRLEALARRIAAAAMLAYHWPEVGSRHDFILTVAGSLLWNGWEDSEVRKFCEAVLYAAGSEGEDSETHGRTIRNAIKNYREGNRIPGWKTLSQWISGSTLKTIRSWVGAKLDEDSPPSTVEPVIEEALDVPPELLAVPGLVGEVANWVSERSYRRQPLFSLAAGLASVAFASRNRYIVDAWDTPLQPYFLMIAPTASGKGAAMDLTYQLMHRVGLKDQVFKGFQSYHALLDRLSMAPNSALWLWDEAARKLQGASRSQGSPEYQGLTYLLELYGQAASCVPGLPARKNSIPAIDYPFFLVMAAAQPEQLLDALTASDLQLGLVNRFILLDAGEKVPVANSHRTNLLPSRLLDGLLAFDRVKRPVDRDPPFHRIRFENARVYHRFRYFVDSCAELAKPGDGAEIWGRTAQNAIICAGIVAIGIEAKRPIITGEIAEWAIAFLTWVSKRWQMRVEQSSSRSVTERGSKYVERIVNSAQRLLHRTRSRSERELAVRGIVAKSMLYRLGRHMRGRELEDTITHLVLADLIASGEVDGIPCYWPKRKGS